MESGRVVRGRIVEGSLPIDHAALAKVDLRLLIAFDAMYRERHVTRAAERIGLRQSAASHALARLRRLFADDLFIRSGVDMLPTPRAVALAPQVEAVLAAIQATVVPSIAFDPAAERRTFTIGLSASLEIALAPSLLCRLRAEAPQARLDVRTAAPAELLGMIDRGSIDLALGGFSDGEHHHRRKVLCEADDYLCLFDPSRTGLSAPISMEDFVAMPHVTVLSNDDAAVALERALTSRGLRRQVAMETPHVLGVPYLVRSAPVVAILCRRTAMICAEGFGLATSELPFDLPMQSVAMVWHASSGNDPANAWLREMIAGCIPWRDGERKRHPWRRHPRDSRLGRVLHD